MKRAKCGCLYEGAVQFCPLHAQAEAMRDTLRALVNGIEAYCTSGDHNALDEPYYAARALLRAGEGK